ncbi:acetyl-lysine deacetylase [Halobacteriales archaeon QS_8_69_26]|nr:MAG: acetyl-lysine deacetylase [Halobacteriales archaeon QS_8_69_26]
MSGCRDSPSGGNDDPVDPRTLLEELVSIPSPTGEEGECARRLRDYLRAAGREAWIDQVGNVRAPGDDAVLLTSHVDTVPGDIEVRVGQDADGETALWGRGSVDAKGPLAAMAVAAVRTGASFVGVIGEEVDSRGARHLVADRDAPEAVVNGEPGGADAVTLAYRGFLAGTYRVDTESAHTSRPDSNAVQAAMAWWHRVESAFPDEGPVFERVTPKPVEFEGGTAADGLSVEATVGFQVRVPPGRDPSSVRARVVEAAGDGVVEWHDSVPPVVADPRSSLATAFRGAIREHDGEPRMVKKTGTSDMNVYADAWDCPTVTYGPGDSSLDHAPDERLPLAEFDRAVAVLETAIERRLRD